MVINLLRDTNGIPPYNEDNIQRNLSLNEFRKVLAVYYTLQADERLKKVIATKVEDKLEKRDIVVNTLRHINGVFDISTDNIATNIITFSCEDDDGIGFTGLLDIDTGRILRNIDIFVKGLEYSYDSIDLDSPIVVE